MELVTNLGMGLLWLFLFVVAVSPMLVVIWLWGFEQRSRTIAGFILLFVYCWALSTAIYVTQQRKQERLLNIERLIEKELLNGVDAA